MFPANVSIVRLSDSKVIPSFDCGDSDLNSFLLNDAQKHQENLLSVTYLVEDANGIIAFFSVFNDKISIQDVESGNQWKKRFKGTFASGKQFRSYPAVKIGRLGVNENYKGSGIGTAILDYIKILFITDNRTGCKYITVDAYSQSISFYEKNKFQYMTISDEKDDTRLMYYPL